MTILCWQVEGFVRGFVLFCLFYTLLWITVKAKDVVECVWALCCRCM